MIIFRILSFDPYGLSLSGIEFYGDAYGDDIIMENHLHSQHLQLTIGLLQDI